MFWRSKRALARLLLASTKTNVMSYYFVIVGTRDNPLYEVQLTSSKTAAPAPLPPNVVSAASLFATGGAPGYGNKNSRHVMQMVAHASLDVLEEVQWTTGTMLVVVLPSYSGRGAETGNTGI